LSTCAPQNGEPWEVIVSDNGSTDGTVAVVEQYQEKLPNLRVVDSSDRRGAAHARMLVPKLLQAGLAFCDADDEVAPGWVAAMGEAPPSIISLAADARKAQRILTLKYRQLTQLNGLQEYSYPPYLPFASGSTLGVERSVHEAVEV